MSYRRTVGETVALTDSAATTPAIDIDKYASGEVYIPTGSPITTLTFHVTNISSGTYLPAYDAAGNAVTQTVQAARAYPIPSTVFGASSMKIVVNAAGSIRYSLKT